MKARYEATPKQGKTRGFREFYDGAKSWSRVERVIARVEAGAEGTDTRFIVTNLNKSNARRLYEDVYCRRWPGREPHQVVEDASGGRPHVLHEGLCQSVSSVPARGRVLADVGVATVNANAAPGGA